MEIFVEVGKTSEFKDVTKKKLTVNEHEILLAIVDDRYYAADNRFARRSRSRKRRRNRPFQSRFPGQITRWEQPSGVITPSVTSACACGLGCIDGLLRGRGGDPASASNEGVRLRDGGLPGAASLTCCRLSVRT